jgi:Rrf2 family protein
MSATNVQFSVALHLMTGLAFNDGIEMTSAHMAESVNTNASFVRKSLSKLVKNGLISATRGKNGSYALARPCTEITLLDIYRASQAPDAFAIHEYPVKDGCPISENIKPCTGEVLRSVQANFERTLESTTLADVVASLRAKAV